MVMLRYRTLLKKSARNHTDNSIMKKSPSNTQLEHWKSRSPARRMAEVPHEIKEALNEGWIESKNLVEWLCVDRKRLANQIAMKFGFEKSFIQRLALLPDAKALKLSLAIGTLLADYITLGDPCFQRLNTHCSDVVREWTAVLIGATNSISFQKRLAWVKPLADDENAGVREVAWIALRNCVKADLETAIACLVPWTGSRRERLRRYASEITRPCGVWAAHIPLLKLNPEMALPILEPLRADSSKYVRDSVANWLNDASKSRGPWVHEIAKRWTIESDCAETALIVKRALRTLRKNPA